MKGGVAFPHSTDLRLEIAIAPTLEHRMLRISEMLERMLNTEANRFGKSCLTTRAHVGSHAILFTQELDDL